MFICVDSEFCFQIDGNGRKGAMISACLNKHINRWGRTKVVERPAARTPSNNLFWQQFSSRSLTEFVSYGGYGDGRIKNIYSDNSRRMKFSSLWIGSFCLVIYFARRQINDRYFSLEIIIDVFMVGILFLFINGVLMFLSYQISQMSFGYYILGWSDVYKLIREKNMWSWFYLHSHGTIYLPFSFCWEIKWLFFFHVWPFYWV